MWTLKGVDVSFLPPKKLTTRTGANNRLLFVSASAGFRATPLSKKTIKKRISESQFYWLTCSLWWTWALLFILSQSHVRHSPNTQQCTHLYKQTQISVCARRNVYQKVAQRRSNTPETRLQLKSVYSSGGGNRAGKAVSIQRHVSWFCFLSWDSSAVRKMSNVSVLGKWSSLKF